MEIDSSLQQWLHQLKEIPKIQHNKKTFLDISGLPHYENIWSNIYAFFLNPNTEHGFNSLFIDCLIDLLEEKGHPTSIQSCDLSIQREYPTKKGGRIDLLLSDNYTAIIIEAKVNHSVNNDFADYWNSISKQYKTGVLLTLRKHNDIKLSNGYFTNITHQEYINKIISKIPEYYLSVNSNYHTFLIDFCQTINNITNPMDTKLVEFYYQNRTQINQLSKIKQKIEGYIIDQFENGTLIKNINRKLELVKKQDKSKECVCYKFNNDIMLTLRYAPLWNWEENGCRVDVYLEVQGKILNKLKLENATFIKTLSESEIKILTNNKSGYEHYAHIRINFDPYKTDDLFNIPSIVADQINHSKLLNIADKIIDFYKQ